MQSNYTEYAPDLARNTENKTCVHRPTSTNITKRFHYPVSQCVQCLVSTTNSTMKIQTASSTKTIANLYQTTVSHPIWLKSAKAKKIKHSCVSWILALVRLQKQRNSSHTQNFIQAPPTCCCFKRTSYLLRCLWVPVVLCKRLEHSQCGQTVDGLPMDLGEGFPPAAQASNMRSWRLLIQNYIQLKKND